MGILLIAKCNPLEDFEVSFLKETIQWYRSGALFHVMRLFIRPKSPTFSGFKLLAERCLQSAEDKSYVLKSPELMNMLKENHFHVRSDNTFVLDEKHYMPISMQPIWKNVGHFGVIEVIMEKPLDVTEGGPLLAFLFSAKAEDCEYSTFNLSMFGSIEIETYLLMPPSTVTVEAIPIPVEEMAAIRLLEESAVSVGRYELWLAVEGHIEATSVESTITPKRNRGFKGESVLEKHYSLPPLKKGWELSIDFRNGSAWFNEVVRCSFKHQRFFLILAWVFGVSTLIGLVLAILAI